MARDSYIERLEVMLADLPRNCAAISEIKGEEVRLKRQRRRAALKGWRTRRNSQLKE